MIFSQDVVRISESPTEEMGNHSSITEVQWNL